MVVFRGEGDGGGGVYVENPDVRNICSTLNRRLLSSSSPDPRRRRSRGLEVGRTSRGGPSEWFESIDSWILAPSWPVSSVVTALEMISAVSYAPWPAARLVGLRGGQPEEKVESSLAGQGRTT